MVEGDDVGSPVGEGLSFPVVEHVGQLVSTDEQFANVAKDEQDNDAWKEIAL